MPFAPPPPLSGTSYAPFPNPDTRYLADRAGLLRPAQQEELNKRLGEAERQSGVRIVAATIQSIRDYPATPNDSIESFGRGLFRAYQIPSNGLLFLIAMKDRQAHIQLGAAYGRRRDADARKIMDEVIVTRLRNGDRSGGLLEGAQALAQAFAATQDSP